MRLGASGSCGSRSGCTASLPSASRTGDGSAGFRSPARFAVSRMVWVSRIGRRHGREQVARFPPAAWAVPPGPSGSADQNVGRKLTLPLSLQSPCHLAIAHRCTKWGEGRPITRKNRPSHIRLMSSPVRRRCRDGARLRDDLPAYQLRQGSKPPRGVGSDRNHPTDDRPQHSALSPLTVHVDPHRAAR